MALPELDGALEPIVFAGRDSNTGKSHSLPDRIESLAKRAIKWATLRKKKNADKKRMDIEFKVGDKVFLSTKNLQVVGKGTSRKLLADRAGPYRITEKLSPFLQVGIRKYLVA